jgi:hypothetical protein
MPEKPKRGAVGSFKRTVDHNELARAPRLAADR